MRASAAVGQLAASTVRSMASSSHWMRSARRRKCWYPTIFTASDRTIGACGPRDPDARRRRRAADRAQPARPAQRHRRRHDRGAPRRVRTGGVGRRRARRDPHRRGQGLQRRRRPLAVRARLGPARVPPRVAQAHAADQRRRTAGEAHRGRDQRRRDRRGHATRARVRRAADGAGRALRLPRGPARDHPVARRRDAAREADRPRARERRDPRRRGGERARRRWRTGWSRRSPTTSWPPPASG